MLLSNYVDRLIEAEAGGGVGEHVDVDGVRDVRLPVGNGALLGGERLEDEAEEGEHGEAAVLELLDLELLEVTGLGEAEGIEATAGVDVTHGELLERVLGEAGAVRLGEADEHNLDGEDGPERGVARAFGGEGRDGTGELVSHGGAVIGGAESARGEPRDAGAVLGSPGASHAKHGPAAVNEFALRILGLVEWDDGGFTTARVGAKLRVEIGGGEGTKLCNLRRKGETKRCELHITRTTTRAVVLKTEAGLTTCGGEGGECEVHDVITRSLTLGAADFWEGVDALVRRATMRRGERAAAMTCIFVELEVGR